MFTLYCWVLNYIIIVINCWCPRNTSHWKKKIGTLPGDIPPRVTPATSEQIVIDLLNVECPLHKCPPAAWNFYHTMQAKHTDLGPLTFSMSLGPNSNKSANKAPRLGLDFFESQLTNMIPPVFPYLHAPHESILKKPPFHRCPLPQQSSGHPEAFQGQATGLLSRAVLNCFQYRHDFWEAHLMPGQSWPWRWAKGPAGTCHW